MRRICVTLTTLFLFTSAAQAAPDAELWERWQTHDEDSTATIDHGAFDAFLGEYVTAKNTAPNLVRYAAVSAADKGALEAYIEALQKIDIGTYNREVQLAYWINLYNAKTLDLVLERYPVDSIRDIGGGLFVSGPWKLKLLHVAGEKLSLNDIQHRILRPIWDDGLSHYGVSCAAIGCPSLRTQAYTAANVYRALHDNARDYVNSEQGVHITDNKLLASKIYDWYAGDFGHSQQAVISHLRRFSAPAQSAQLDALERIDGYRYNWALNDAHARAKRGANGGNTD